MTLLYVFLIFTFGVWIRRAILMMGSIERYSCIPELSWNPDATNELVSIIVPCRNEAHNLDTLIPSLLNQDYPNLEFIFLDDRSTDSTLERLEFYQKKDPRIRILMGKPLPEGWTGKNHALSQCAQAAEGRWLLFTDADTFHERYSVSSSVRYASEKHLDLLTLSARCVCKSFGEHLVQPMGIGCFSVWFRLEKVNNPTSKTPLCCGQYLMIDKEVYKTVGTNERVKADVTEDLALFKVVKDAGYRCELSIGSHLFATRMYRSFREAWIGWRRIYLHGLQKDTASILRKIGMLIFYSSAPFFIFFGASWAVLAGKANAAGIAALSGTLCAFILLLRIKSHQALRADRWSVLLHPLSALVITGILVDCLHHHFRGRKVEWKMQKY